MKNKKTFLKWTAGTIAVAAICFVVALSTNVFNNHSQNSEDSFVAPQEQAAVAQQAENNAAATSTVTKETAAKDTVTKQAVTAHFAEDAYAGDTAAIEVAHQAAQNFEEKYKEEKAAENYNKSLLGREGVAGAFAAASGYADQISTNGDTIYYGLSSDGTTLYVSNSATSEATQSYNSSNMAPWTVDPDKYPNPADDPFFKIKKVVIQSEVHPANCFAMFGCAKQDPGKKTWLSNIESFEGLNNIKYDNTTDVSFMFAGCNLASSDTLNPTFNDAASNYSFMLALTNFDADTYKNISKAIKKVSQADYAFANCANVTTLDIGSWELESTTVNINSLFYNCKNLVTIYARSNTDWTNVDAKTENKGAWHLFENCNSLEFKAGIDKPYKYSEHKSEVDANASAYVRPYSAEHPGLITVLYSITVGNDGHGTAHASKTIAEPGETISLTVDSAETGYEFNEWQSDQVTIAHNQFTVPAQDVTVKAIFKQTDYSITVNSPGEGSGGTASADKTTAHYGDTVQLTATPDSGYKLSSWTSSPQVTIAEDNTFNMPASNVIITANFKVELETYTLGGSTVSWPESTITARPNSPHIKADTTDTVEYTNEAGSTQEIVASPATGYGKVKTIDIDHTKHTITGTAVKTYTANFEKSTSSYCQNMTFNGQSPTAKFEIEDGWYWTREEYHPIVHFYSDSAKTKEVLKVTASTTLTNPDWDWKDPTSTGKITGDRTWTVFCSTKCTIGFAKGDRCEFTYDVKFNGNRSTDPSFVWNWTCPTGSTWYRTRDDWRTTTFNIITPFGNVKSIKTDVDDGETTGCYVWICSDPSSSVITGDMKILHNYNQGELITLKGSNGFTWDGVTGDQTFCVQKYFASKRGVFKFTRAQQTGGKWKFTLTYGTSGGTVYNTWTGLSSSSSTSSDKAYLYFKTGSSKEVQWTSGDKTSTFDTVISGKF